MTSSTQHGCYSITTEAGIRWVGNDGSSQHKMLGKIRATVDRVLNEFNDDTQIVAEILADFTHYIKNIARRQELMEKRAAEKAQGEERLREVKQRVNDEVTARTEGHLPASVQLLCYNLGLITCLSVCCAMVQGRTMAGRIGGDG